MKERGAKGLLKAREGRGGGARLGRTHCQKEIKKLVYWGFGSEKAESAEKSDNKSRLTPFRPRLHFYPEKGKAEKRNGIQKGTRPRDEGEGGRINAVRCRNPDRKIPPNNKNLSKKEPSRNPLK